MSAVRHEAEVRRGVLDRLGAAAGRGPSQLAGRLGVPRGELGWLAAITLLAAILRFVNLPARGGWDSDQASSMFDLQHAISTGQLPTFGPLSSLLTFHHGALYYDLLLPAAWLGNGDPTWVVAEIALLSLLVVPAVWWIARTIGGPTAGLTAAFLVAISASLIGYATFIWNPTLVEPGASIAFLGAWQALRTRKAAWWTVAAAGAAGAAQAHIAAAVIVLPLAAAFILDLWRGPASRRGRIAAWGLGGVAVFVATWLPLIVYEVGHDYPETRGMLAYFLSGSSASSNGPLVRLIFATIRIIAWPLTRWPMIDLKPAFPAALITASAIIALLIWLVAATAGPPSLKEERAAPEAVTGAEMGSTEPVRRSGASTAKRSPAIDRFGVRLIGFWLLFIILVLGLGLHSVSEVQALPTEQYHVIADPLVFVAVGLIAGALWQRLPRRRLTLARRAAVAIALGALLAWNVGHWPPLTSPDGGWPAAEAAAARLERDAGGSPMALVPLFVPKGSDAYLYPLSRDGLTLVSPQQATTVVLLCDTFWLTGCDGAAQKTWVDANPAGNGLERVDQFAAAPDRILTVYRRAP